MMLLSCVLRYELEQRSAGRFSRPIPSGPPVIVFEVICKPFSPETLLAAIPSDPVPLWEPSKEYTADDRLHQLHCSIT